MGASQRCERRMGYGLYLTTDVAPSLWGGYATHLYLHPDAQIEKAPTHIPSDVMTLFHPLSGVVHWIYEIPKLRMAEHVVILGPGQRGILAALTARHAGAKTVTISGLPEDHHRLALARELGADAIVDVSKEDIVERVHEVTAGEMADVVLDMSAGSTAPVLQALDVARMGGRVVLAGSEWQANRRLVTDKIVVKGLQVLGGSARLRARSMSRSRCARSPQPVASDLFAFLRPRSSRPCGAHARPRGRRRQGGRACQPGDAAQMRHALPDRLTPPADRSDHRLP
jgi:alcohol dehydrogenase